MTKEELISLGWKVWKEKNDEYEDEWFEDKFGCLITFLDLKEAVIFQDFISKEEIRATTLSDKELLEQIIVAYSNRDNSEDPDKESLRIEILTEEFYKRAKKPILNIP